MVDERSWHGLWKSRLYARVHERGYNSLTAFAEARPAMPLVTLAGELGRNDDVHAVQVLSGLLAEAEQRKQVARFERDVLVRMFSHHLPEGWPSAMNDQTRFAVGKMPGLWMGYTPEAHQEHSERGIAALLATPPSPDWRPLGPDDELLHTLQPDEEA